MREASHPHLPAETRREIDRTALAEVGVELARLGVQSDEAQVVRGDQDTGVVPVAPVGDASVLPADVGGPVLLPALRVVRPRTRYELMNKCSCALDRLGETYSVDEFVDARTTAKAITISGERGAALRDNKQAKVVARTYHDSVKRAEADCFLR